MENDTDKKYIWRHIKDNTNTYIVGEILYIGEYIETDKIWYKILRVLRCDDKVWHVGEEVWFNKSEGKEGVNYKFLTEDEALVYLI
ncbi:MAG: hypothetical protein IMZ59_04745 [Actinobacteria bacterium]|nr:hypothetical protein [Actinomycetota bacterium]